MRPQQAANNDETKSAQIETIIVAETFDIL